MALKEFWIQIENRAWDVCPRNINRMSGQTQQQITGNAPVVKTLTSPETGIVRNRTMYRPLEEDALILRHYTANWAVPDDRKVNPWDLNEPDPTDNGTMGTIPGATIECNVGDKVIVNFRNKDFRVGKDIKARTHSLHPHGIVFAPTSDGAYPLSPPDPAQPIPAAEAVAWASVGVAGSKKSDRVPPGGTFTYTWDTFGWPTTAGVWHYHDHAICDAENVILGAIAFLVIHNPQDPDDVVEQDLPGGLPNGPLVQIRCFPIPFPVPVLPHDLEGLPLATGETTPEAKGRGKKAEKPGYEKEAPIGERAVQRGDLIFELDKDFVQIARICLPFYVDPPERAQYLQYYHEMPGVGMLINGRKYMGNTPTLIGGLNTKMRFGLAAMNNLLFHTFHLHGHRWVIAGPQGNTPADIQSSPQIHAVSQFEDTRIFGPANSFSFTINQGSFMGSVFTPDPSRAPGVGEWHMHCHVLQHMMGPGPVAGGMMGSLLVIRGGELAFSFFLPRGEPCATEEPLPQEVVISGFTFPPATIQAGGTITFTNNDPANHSVVWDTPGAPPNSPTIAPGGGTWPVVMSTAGTFNYHCGFHPGMLGSITVTP